MADAVQNLITALQNNKASSDGVSEPVHVPINLFIAALQEIEIAVGPVTGNQSDNTVFAGPATGPASPPTFRLLVGSDLPAPSATTLGGVESFAAVANEFLTQISNAGVVSAAQPAMANISDYVNGTWTPTDASGASIVFTITQGWYFRAGNFIIAGGRVEYPVTASGATSSIGGLPLTVANKTSAEQGVLSSSTSAAVVEATPVFNTTDISPGTSTGGTILNSTLSGISLWFCAIYPLS
jgi:hypothetical protein